MPPHSLMLMQQTSSSSSSFNDDNTCNNSSSSTSTTAGNSNTTTSSSCNTHKDDNGTNEGIMNDVGMYIDQDVDDGCPFQYQSHDDEFDGNEKWEPIRKNEVSVTTTVATTAQKPVTSTSINGKIRLLCQTRSPSFETLPTKSISADATSTKAGQYMTTAATTTTKKEDKNEACHIRFRFMSKLGIRSVHEEKLYYHRSKTSSTCDPKTEITPAGSNLKLTNRRPLFLQELDVPLKDDYGRVDVDLSKIMQEEKDKAKQTVVQKVNDNCKNMDEHETEVYYCCVPKGGIKPVLRSKPTKTSFQNNDSNKTYTDIDKKNGDGNKAGGVKHNAIDDDRLFDLGIALDESTSTADESHTDDHSDQDESVEYVTSSSPTSVTTGTTSTSATTGSSPMMITKKTIMKEVPNDDCKAKKTKKNKSILFDSKVHVWVIPNRKSYSKRISDTIWTNPIEMEQNAARNTYEYSAEQWDYNCVAVDEDMVICPVTGEKIHPIHFIQ